MFYMISGVQRLWQIFRLNPLTVEPSRPISDKRRENNTPRPRLPPQREEKAPEDGHQIDEFV